MHDVKAVLLVGGLGTRLRSVSALYAQSACIGWEENPFLNYWFDSFVPRESTVW